MIPTSFKFYGVTHSYSSCPFLCVLAWPTKISSSSLPPPSLSVYSYPTDLIGYVDDLELDIVLMSYVKNSTVLMCCSCILRSMASMMSARGSMDLLTSGVTAQRYLITSVSLPLLMARYVPYMAVWNMHTSLLHPMVFPFCTLYY